MLGSLNLFSRWLVTKYVPSSDSIQEAPGGFKTRAGLACSNLEALTLYIVFRDIQIFHDLSFLVSSDFGFLSFFPTCQVRVVRFYVSLDLPFPPPPPPPPPPPSPRPIAMMYCDDVCSVLRAGPPL